jgi:hypothetical protein
MKGAGHIGALVVGSGKSRLCDQDPVQQVRVTRQGDSKVKRWVLHGTYPDRIQTRALSLAVILLNVAGVT